MTLAPLVLLAAALGQAPRPATGLDRALGKMAARDYAGALALLEGLARAPRPDPLVHYQIGVCQTVLGRHPEALSALDRAAAAGLDGTELRTSLGIACFNTGDNPRARRELEQALALDPANMTALLYLGRLDLKERRYADAEPRLRRVLEAEPRNDEALFALGRSLVLQGRAAEGKPLLEIHRRRTFLNDRVKTLRELAARSDASAATLVELGDAYLELGERTPALDSYTRAERIDPGTDATALGRGKASYQAGDFETAQQVLLRAGADATRRCEAGLYRGLSLRALKRSDEARGVLEEVVATCPPDVRALANLGELAIQRRDLDRALELSQAIVRLDAAAPAAPYLAAVCRLYRGDLDGAEAAALEAARLDPADPEYHRLLRAIYRAKGDADKARSHEVQMETLLGRRKGNR